jgi:c-di-GMP-binding flagellar brake protein YcgR
MISEPEQGNTWLVLYGRVLRSTPQNGGETDVAVCFFDMDVAVQETLIRYMLNRQREQIRRQREEKD